MKLVDANVLIYAANRNAKEHARAVGWMETALSGHEPIAFAWAVLLSFLRVATRPGLLPRPLEIADAFGLLESWLSPPAAAIIHPGENHLRILQELVDTLGTAGDLTSDAHLAALAIEHGAELVSFDRDFLRFDGLRTVILKP